MGWNTKADGTGTDYAPNATFPIGAANVTLYAKWSVSIASISAGLSYTMILKEDGTLWGTGDNYYGQLGDGTTGTEAHTPLQISY